jgi:hypothetical protein
MRYRAILLAMSVGLGVVSCGENSPPPAGNAGAGELNSATAAPGEHPQQLVTQAPPQPTAPRSPQAASRAPAAAGKPAPATPKVMGSPTDLASAPNAQYTILVYTERGPGHVEQAATDKQLIIQKTGRTDCYVISQSDVSNIYFGAYRTIDDPKDRREAQRAHADMEMLKKLELFVDGPTGRELSKPFEHCALVQMSAPDPDSPPQWDLANVDKDKDPKDPTRAFWSLQIMAFKGMAERKQYAVAMVRDLREKGVPAYYYHGESISSVCVGAWPPLAVKAQDSDGSDARTLTPHLRPDQALLVTAEPLPDGIVPRKQNGEDIIAVAPKLEVMDPTMVQMIRKFPDHILNGYINYHKTRSGGKVKDPTFLVVIPRAKGNGLYDADDAPPPPPPAAVAGGAEPGAFGGGTRQVGSAGTPANAPTQSVQPQQAPATPGVGRLRRIGEN